MPINACSINQVTINSLCSPARSKIIDNLLEIRYSEHVSGVGTRASADLFYRYNGQHTDRVAEPVAVEIIVAVEMLSMNMRGIDTQPLETRHDLVAVSNLSFEEQVSLNTTDLTIN
jgi:hypothetical protein